MTKLQMTEVPHHVADEWLEQDPAVEAFSLDDRAENISERFRFRVGNRPFARSVSAYYAANGRALPAAYAALPGEVYLVTHGVGIEADGHAGRIQTIRYSASFDGAGSTVDLLPSTRFRSWFGADLTFKATLEANGHAAAPGVTGELADVIGLGADAKLELAAGADVLGQLSLRVVTPKIQTVGQASTIASWQLDKDDEPLVGDQVLVQSVVVPRECEKLPFNIEASASINRNVFGWPVTLSADPLQVEVDLAEM